MDNNLFISRTRQTLVDQVEEKLIEYFKEQGLRPGSSIPNEIQLASSLGIGRTVLREALSRFKMTGMIISRTKRGMVLGEPSILTSLQRCVNPLLMTEATIRDIFEFRIMIEVGCTTALFARITKKDIEELEKIVRMEKAMEDPLTGAEHCGFHDKIYDITGNNMVCEFQQAIMPALDYVMNSRRKEFAAIEKEQEEAGEFVSHQDLLNIIKEGDIDKYNKAIVKHFSIYKEYMLAL